MVMEKKKKVKLLCSYGGKIHSRPSDRQLSYIGGDTKILALDRTVNFSDFIAKLNSLSNTFNHISVKYQLPGEDLDSLVSLIDDDDVEHMMVEYDRMQRISPKPARLRIFVFDRHPVKSGPVSGNPDYLFGFDKEYQPSIEPPPPDLLQIPAAPVAQVVYYREPAVVSGGLYMAPAGNREQPVYKFIPTFQ